jgi:hypothetical protein
MTADEWQRRAQDGWRGLTPYLGPPRRLKRAVRASYGPGGPSRCKGTTGDRSQAGSSRRHPFKISGFEISRFGYGYDGEQPWRA